MTRIARSAQVLADQVTAQRKTAKTEFVGEPDGLDVIREVSFDKATSKWLKPLLEAIEDPRIQWLDVEDDVLTVVFSGSTDADNFDEFPLEAAETVTSG